MTPETHFSSDHAASRHTERAIWATLIVGSAIALTPLYACATPFAALATIAALKLDRRSMIVTIGLVWLANQAIGYGVLGYPWSWNSVAWGFAIGAASSLSVIAACSLATTRSAPLAVSLPFMAAFTTFELGLYVAGIVLSAGDGAFSLAIVGHIFAINALALCGLMVLYHLVSLAGRMMRPAAGPPEPVQAHTYR